MSENRELLNEAEVDFLLAGAAEDDPVEAPSISDGSHTVTMHGDLEQISLADIFQTLAMSKLEGVLRVCNPLEERQVYCCDGYVRILVPQRLTVRRLGQRLIQAGLIKPDQLRLALLQQRKEKMPLGQLLIREGMIESSQIDEIVEMQVAEDLFALFTWRHGTFEFFKGELGSAGLRAQFEQCPQYGVNSLLLEVARRSDEWESILAAITSLDEVPRIVADPAEPDALEESHRIVLSGVNEAWTYRQLSEHHTIGLFEFARAARDLVSGGILSAIDDDALVGRAMELVEEGESRRAVVLLQTLRDRPGDRSLPVVQGMAKVLIGLGERRFASSLLLEAAQCSGDAEQALDLARSARDLVPYDPGTLSFLRTVLIAHDRPDSAELEKVTIELLDALIDADLVPTALEICADARLTETLKPQILMREARARQKTRDVEGATGVLLELAALYGAENNRQKAIEAYEAVLRIDRSRRDVQKLLKQLRRTHLGRLVRLTAVVVAVALLGGMGFIWWQQSTFETRVEQARHEIGALLEQGDRKSARELLAALRGQLGDCEPIQDFANRIAFAEAAEDNRMAKLRRAKLNEQLAAAAQALGLGQLADAMRIYGQTSRDQATAAEVEEVVRTRLGALLEELRRTAENLDGRLPADPNVLFDRRELTKNLTDLQSMCPPVLLQAHRELADLVAADGIPSFVSAELQQRTREVLTAVEPVLVRTRELATAYTEALQHNETQRRLDPMFKAAVEKEQQHLFGEALELYRALEQQPAGDTDLRAHFRDRVTRNATIVRLLDELRSATRSGDFVAAQQHLRALRMSYPEVPFDTLVQLPLAVTSEPTGATIHCNGKELGQTPLLLARVPADATRLVVSMAGFENASTTVSGDNDARWMAHLVLSPQTRWQHGSPIDTAPTAMPDGDLVFVDRAGHVIRRSKDLERTVWSFASGDLSGYLTQPLVHGQLVLVASLDGELRALHADTGKPAWSLPELPCEVQPVRIGNRMFLASIDHRLHAIDLGEKRRLSIDLPEPAHGELIAAGDRVLVVGRRGLVSCWSPDGLQALWQRPLDSMASARAVLVASQLVLADDQGRVAAIDVRTGEVRWRRELATTTLGRMTCAGNKALLVTPERILRLDLGTGADLEAFPKNDLDWASEATACGNRLVVQLHNQQLQVLAADTGQLLYRLIGARRCRVLQAGERVLISSDDHVVSGYDQLR